LTIRLSEAAGLIAQTRLRGIVYFVSGLKTFVETGEPLAVA
jgi:hypothetical protein